MNESQIKVFVGCDILETLTAALYADPLIVFREYVQNALDSFNRSDVKPNERKVEITIDVSHKNITIEDNGAGIASEQFENTMRSIGGSSKQGDATQIGFKGIGRLSGLSFCDKLVFTNISQGQWFGIDGKKYREYLNGLAKGIRNLESEFSEITSFGTCEPSPKSGFKVEMRTVCHELMHIIVGRKLSDEQRTMQSYSKEFKWALMRMLPLPYSQEFKNADIIRKRFYTVIGKELFDYECNITLRDENGKEEVLTKDVPNIDRKEFIIMDVNLSISDEECVHAGIVWLAFDPVFRSIGKDFGICVRSQNMLVQGGSVFANEASQALGATTTFGQYLAASKCIIGEMLLDTKKLTDNSKRDWFKPDVYSLALRNVICSMMNGVHQYRYAVSRYINSDTRGDALRQRVLDAYKQITSCDKQVDMSSIEHIRVYLKDTDDQLFTREIDVKSDPRDLRGYPKSKKSFYKDIMDIIYDFCCNENNSLKNGISGYYEIKSYIVKRLNEEVGEKTDA